MKSFKDHSIEMDEAFTQAQRNKAKATFKKNKSKIALGKKKASKRLASPEKLKTKANKKARDIVTDKILKGKSKSDLSFAARQGLEKQVDKKKGMIGKLSKKLLPSIKKADKEKLKKNKGGEE
tara:strand:- start:1948 stop:2316 length:369 start_codon:yes stop_codon:yes gene_type:complete